MSTWNRRAALLVLAGLFAPHEANAQRRGPQGPTLPRPRLTSVYPLGVQAGGTSDATLRGNDLEGVTTLWFDHPGLRAFHLKGQTFRVVCSTGATVGHHDVRAVGTYGVSNPRAFVVGDRPESTEVEPNNTPGQAREVPFDSVVHGEIGTTTDVDCFAFLGKKGQRVFADLDAERVDSRLDATLRLLDPSGREIAESRDVVGVDPFLDVTLPADGRYVLKLHDVTYRGSNEFPYRLTLGGGPRVDAVVPSVMRAGETTRLTLFGRNLGGESVPGLNLDGRPLETRTVTVTAPACPDTEGGPFALGVVPSGAGTRRGFEYVFESATGRANPVFIALGKDPVLIEAEPNDDAEHAQTVAVPCDVSGCFNAPGDVDLYRFRAKKGEVWWVEASAERIGSPADPLFTIQKVNSNGTSDLATAEDLPDRGGLARFNTATVDAAQRWTAPEDGLYQIAVVDLFGSQRGDVRLAYRLNVRPERPDFQLFLLPAATDRPDALTLNSGGRALAYVLACRSDGFDGPIRVEAVDLPLSVKFDPVTIPAGQSVVPVVFEAAADASSDLGVAKLVGRAKMPSAEEVRREALSGSMVWGPVVAANNNNNQQVPQNAPARLTRGFAVKVVGPAALLLTATPSELTVTPGGLLTLDVSAKRSEGFTEAVAVSLLSPLQGVTTPPAATIAKGSESTTLAFTVPRTQPVGTYTWVVQGTGPYPFSKDAAAKTKPNVTLNEPSNPVTVRVRTSPLSVSLTGKGPLKAGGSMEVTVTIDVKDKGKAQGGPFAVALVGPASLKLSAEPVQVEVGKPATLVLKAAADSPVGAAVGVGVRVSVPDGRETVDVVEPYAVTIAK